MTKKQLEVENKKLKQDVSDLFEINDKLGKSFERNDKALIKLKAKNREDANLQDKITTLEVENADYAKMLSDNKSKIKVDAQGLQDAIDQYQNDMSELENNILSRDIVIENLTFDVEKLNDKRIYVVALAKSRRERIESIQDVYEDLSWFKKFFTPNVLKEELDTLHIDK